MYVCRLALLGALSLSLTACLKDAEVLSTDVSSVESTTLTISNVPSGTTSTTNLNITIGGTILSYSYFIGSGTVDCNSGTYSVPRGAGIAITDNIGVGGMNLSDGTVYVCVIGQKSDGSWQTYPEATNRSWTKDTTGPQIISVTSTTNDGVFQSGAPINLRLTFNEEVNFSAGSGEFRVKFATGQSDDYASTSTSVSGVTMLDLYYIVEADDYSVDLNFDASMAPVLFSGATIKDASGNDVQLSLLSSGMYLSSTKNIKLVGTPAQLTILDPDVGSPFNFGTRYVGSDFIKTFELTNSASAVVPAYINGNNFGAPYFSYDGTSYPGIGGTCGPTIAPGAAPCTIRVKFSAGSVVNINANLNLNYDNGVNPAALLQRNLSAVAIMPWEPTSDSNAPTQRVGHTIVKAGDKVIVWGGRNNTTYLSTGAIFDPVTNSWVATSDTNAPSARANHTAVWTGTEMIIWGGQGTSGVYLNSGAKFNPTTQTWSPVAPGSAARSLHTAVWTGSAMLVWGGYNGTSQLSTGSSYDPVLNGWNAITPTNAPAARSKHTAVWTGTKMVIWGGFDGSGVLGTGAIYNPSNTSWTATSTTSVPAARYGHAAVWSGSRMIIWGGNDGVGTYLSTGANFDPDSSTNGIWEPMNNFYAPSGRTDMAFVWTGTKLIVWGGYDGASLDTGGIYDPLAGTGGDWFAVNISGAPSPRLQAGAVWLGNKFFVWGGSSTPSPIGVATGGMYTPLPPN